MRKNRHKKCPQQQYTHASIWFIIAEALLGFGDKAVELAELINVSVDTVRRWESNKQFPRADELLNLASVLKITVDELLNDSSSGKVEITLSWDWSEMKKGDIDMDANKFKLILGEDGKIGLHGAGQITSREAIEDFLSQVREQLEIGLEAQIKRGVVQGA